MLRTRSVLTITNVCGDPGGGGSTGRGGHGVEAEEVPVRLEAVATHVEPDDRQAAQEFGIRVVHQ